MSNKLHSSVRKERGRCSFQQVVGRLHRKYVAADTLVGEARQQHTDAEMALKDAERWRDEAHHAYWKARKANGG